MKKNNIVSFYIVNILTCILEVGIIILLIYLDTSDLLKSIFIGGIWLALGLFGFLLLKTNQKNKSLYEEGKSQKYEEFENEIEDIKKEFKKYYKKDVSISYTDIILNPAGAVSDDLIFVNPKFIKSKEYKNVMRGIIAHEYGHISSGLIKHSPITFIHFGAIFQFLFYFPFVMHAKNKGKNIYLNILIYILLSFAIILNIFNYLSIFYYYRKDEHIANYNSIVLGGAEELRTYYFVGHLPDRLMQLLDVKHPTIDAMLEKMNNWMNKNEFERRIYLAKNRISIINIRDYHLDYNTMKFMYYRHHQNEHPNFKYEYGICCYRGLGVDENIEKALKIFSELSFPEAIYMQGMCQLKLGQFNKALKSFSKSDYLKAKLELCKLLHKLNRDEEAIEVLESIKDRIIEREYKALKKQIDVEVSDV